MGCSHARAGGGGVDEGIEIAQESHQCPNCLAKSFSCARERCGPNHMGKAYPMHSVRKGGLEWEKREITRRLTGPVHQAESSWNGILHTEAGKTGELLDT